MFFSFWIYIDVFLLNFLIVNLVWLIVLVWIKLLIVLVLIRFILLFKKFFLLNLLGLVNFVLLDSNNFKILLVIIILLW